LNPGDLYGRITALEPAGSFSAVKYEKPALIKALTGFSVVDSIQLTDVFYAEVAKLVYALDLGSSAARCESSSLSFRTKLMRAASPCFQYGEAAQCAGTRSAR
jgi:hypothetical protein